MKFMKNHRKEISFKWYFNCGVNLFKLSRETVSLAVIRISEEHFNDIYQSGYQFTVKGNVENNKKRYEKIIQ